MANINLNNAEFEGCASVPASTEPAPRQYSPSLVPISPPGNLLQPLPLGMITPAEAVLGVVNGALNAVNVRSAAVSPR